jgi:hypothetical protein
MAIGPNPLNFEFSAREADVLPRALRQRAVPFAG